jgi:lambda repressor-like predicted transcriptional regulator
MAAPRKRESFDEIRQEQKEWLGGILKATGKTISGLAREAGLSDTTLSRFFNNPAHRGKLDDLTVKLIAEATGLAPPGGFSAPRQSPYEAIRFQNDNEPDALVAAVNTLKRGRANAHAWTMTSDVLQLAGVRTGDIIIIDMDEAPRSGDIVCAQIETQFGATTVFRVYQMPYLVGASPDPFAVLPDTVNGTSRRIAGVMTDLIRRRP